MLLCMHAKYIVSWTIKNLYFLLPFVSSQVCLHNFQPLYTVDAHTPATPPKYLL